MPRSHSPNQRPCQSLPGMRESQFRSCKEALLEVLIGRSSTTCGLMGQRGESRADTLSENSGFAMRERVYGLAVMRDWSLVIQFRVGRNFPDRALICRFSPALR